jgi:hypothetical protein
MSAPLKPTAYAGFGETSGAKDRSPIADRRLLIERAPNADLFCAVLTRPQNLAACGLSASEVERVLDDLAAVAQPVRLAFR